MGSRSPSSSRWGLDHRQGLGGVSVTVKVSAESRSPSWPRWGLGHRHGLGLVGVSVTVMVLVGLGHRHGLGGVSVTVMVSVGSRSPGPVAPVRSRSAWLQRPRPSRFRWTVSGAAVGGVATGTAAAPLPDRRRCERPNNATPPTGGRFARHSATRSVWTRRWKKQLIGCLAADRADT